MNVENMTYPFFHKKEEDFDHFLQRLRFACIGLNVKYAILEIDGADVSVYRLTNNELLGVDIPIISSGRAWTRCNVPVKIDTPLALKIFGGLMEKHGFKLARKLKGNVLAVYLNDCYFLPSYGEMSVEATITRNSQQSFDIDMGTNEALRPLVVIVGAEFQAIISDTIRELKRMFILERLEQTESIAEVRETVEHTIVKVRLM